MGRLRAVEGGRKAGKLSHSWFFGETKRGPNEAKTGGCREEKGGTEKGENSVKKNKKNLEEDRISLRGVKCGKLETKNRRGVTMRRLTALGKVKLKKALA